MAARLLSIQMFCVKSLLSLVLKSYKKLCMNDKTIIELGSPKYRDLFVARRSNFEKSSHQRQDYFTQCHPIIDNFLSIV